MIGSDNEPSLELGSWTKCGQVMIALCISLVTFVDFFRIILTERDLVPAVCNFE